jgi:uncharacterized membrane protein (DUF106 family)
MAWQPKLRVDQLKAKVTGVEDRVEQLAAGQKELAQRQQQLLQQQ